MTNKVSLVRRKLRTSPRAVLFVVTALFLSVTTSGALNIVRANASSQPGLSSLKSTIDGILADPRLNGAQVGVLVRDAKDGSVLYAHNSTSLLVPASNDKIYTSNAALKVLGSDYRFTTTAATDGSQAAGIISGNLYLKGTGDPTMQAADYDALASSIAAKGVRLVTGHLVADDTFFDHRQLGYTQNPPLPEPCTIC
jgi:D-alanyl-D-alanine carboxypeptidase/D-alanyl-D-alanine-endopeptidase (penicillin-binding protein 4)